MGITGPPTARTTREMGLLKEVAWSSLFSEAVSAKGVGWAPLGLWKGRELASQSTYYIIGILLHVFV